jgi:hypothetical protein
MEKKTAFNILKSRPSDNIEQLEEFALRNGEKNA